MHTAEHNIFNKNFYKINMHIINRRQDRDT